MARAVAHPCGLGDLVCLAWTYSFMVGMDQVGLWLLVGIASHCAQPTGRQKLWSCPQHACWHAAGGSDRTGLSPLPTPQTQLLVVAGAIESAQAQQRDSLSGWLQGWRAPLKHE